MGQVQYWFLFKYRGDDRDIQLPKGGELAAWSWRPFDWLLQNGVAFRRPAYAKLKDYFRAYLR